MEWSLYNDIKRHTDNGGSMRHNKKPWLNYRVPAYAWVWRVEDGKRTVVCKNPNHKAIVVGLPKDTYVQTSTSSRSTPKTLKNYVENLTRRRKKVNNRST